MAKARQWSSTFVTPIAEAVYPWLNTPDTRFQGSDYKVNLRLNEEDGLKLKEKLEAMALEALEYQKKIDPSYKKLKQLKIPLSLELDEDGEEIEGSYILKLKSRSSFMVNGEEFDNKPTIVDANKEPTDAQIYGGSKIRVKTTVAAYDTFGGGLTMRIKAVQVIELAEGRANSVDDFDVEDGYTAPKASVKEPEIVGGDDDF